MKKIIASVLTIVLLFSLAFACVAADFTPSVTAKPAPEIVPIDPENPDVITYVKDANNNVTPVALSQIDVTALAGKEEASSEEIKKNLEKAYNDVNDGKLDKIIIQMSEQVGENLVASDLFDVTVTDEILEALNSSDDAYLPVRFKVPYVPASVLHLDTKTNTWKSVAPEDIIDNKDGTVTVNFRSLCPVIFLKATGEPAPEPAKDGIPTWVIVLICIAVLAVIVIIIVLVSGKKNNKNTDKKKSDTTSNK
ncbi:MAG: hypothetical protein ACI4QR_05290 [Eubacteriales bacterium]